MKRVVTALALVAGATFAPGTAHAASCGGFNALVLNTGAQVTQLQTRSVSCGAARNTATAWLRGLSRRDAFVDCAPSSGAPSATCAIGHFSCRATPIRGSQGNTMRCHSGRRTVSWTTRFNGNAGPDWEEL